jgi:chromosomal replication initiator protein
MEDFKRKFQNSDILMLEDLQSLTGRTKTQEELSSILDILMESGKTVIFTGGKSPKEIEGLETGVRSRMSSGLITTIGEPDLETKARIVAKKAERLKLHLSEELTWYLAEQIKGDMRQIKSAIVGLKAKSSIRKQEADLEMLKEVLANIISQAKTITPEDIRDYIAGQFRLNPSDLLSKSRKKIITFPRQVSMYFSRKYTKNALSEIGRAFNRDHSTVVHSIRVVSEAMNNDNSVQGQIKILDGKLYEKFLS